MLDIADITARADRGTLPRRDQRALLDALHRLEVLAESMDHSLPVATQCRPEIEVDMRPIAAAIREAIRGGSPVFTGWARR